MKSSVKKKFWICFIVIAVVLIIDQVMKIWVKTHFALGQGVDLIGDWCKIYFVENIGMAFGMSLGNSFGKLFLTLFRIVASVFIMWYLIKQIKRDARYIPIISISLIFVGAIGNIVDSCLYGIIFSESTSTTVATLFPDGETYGSFLYGKVVDMFYFPICSWTWPSWMPLCGGEQYEFFSAIFNVADAAITIGIILIFFDQIFLRKNVSSEEIKSSDTDSDAQEAASSVDHKEGKIAENTGANVAAEN